MTKEVRTPDNNRVIEHYVAAVLGILAAGGGVTLLGVVLWLLVGELPLIGPAILGGSGIAIGIIFLAVILGRRKKGRLAVRLLLGFVLGIASIAIAWATIGFTTDLALENATHFQAIAFAVGLALSLVVGGFCGGAYKVLYVGRASPAKATTPGEAAPTAGSWWQRTPLGKWPTRGLMGLSIVMLVLAASATGVLGYKVWVAPIDAGTGHADGPWATWHANPQSSITIAWLTATSNTTTVYYGTDPDQLNRTYFDPNSVILHKAVITDLAPDTTYYYRIPEAFETPHASTTFQFRTAPATVTKIRFAVFGDKQPTNAHLLTSNGFVADGIIARGYDFVCQVGDLASSGTNANDWHMTLDSLARVGATSPLLMVIGNHDWNGIQGAANWRRLFTYPWAGTVSSSYYSMDYGSAHFVMVDNFELFYRMSAGQLSWIERDVQAARARGAKWVFALFHLTVFTTATSGLKADLQRQLLPLFDRLGVDACFFGHDHHYEHYNYTYGANGLLYSPEDQWTHSPVQYFCTGGGGANLEVDYGVLSMNPRDYAVQWYNTSAAAYQTIEYKQHPWNASRYVTHPSFARNYTQYSASGTHDGKYYYHAPSIESYFNIAPTMGFTYGEQAYHFMDVEVDGDTCTIRALYPNGEVMKGPSDAMPQIYVLRK